MSNNDIVNRDQIIGKEVQDFGFDKVLRGYDVKQVNEYINNLLAANKNAGELFDQRFSEIQNENSMLSCELSQIKGEFEKINALYENCRRQRDEYKSQLDGPVITQADSVKISELQEKIDSLISKNRLLGEENRKLEEKNRDLQRDVTHLTKKADKNRFEINNLKQELEVGMSSDSAKKYSEISQIYASAIDKAEDLIYRLQTELSLAHSKAEDVASGEDNE
ncbi:MAG: hypothetical protein PUE08_00015 [Eubacteriales bacterium]|nr:hypothetical protein [Eubacteriales bacterium]